jgi:hypothetical protein
LEADAVAAGFKGFVLAGGTFGPVVLAMVATEEPQFLKDGVGVALVEASEVFPLVAEGGGGGEGGGDDAGRFEGSWLAGRDRTGCDEETGDGKTSELAKEGVGGRWEVWHEEAIFDIQSDACHRSKGISGALKVTHFRLNRRLNFLEVIQDVGSSARD